MFLQRINKKIAIVFALLILHQAIFPEVALALTGGPSQPEVEGFKPIGATDMVDLFTGDFSYNIPLMDVDGYPINISYQSNPSMDEEASWVGLGWTLNPGVMNRDVRGFPDDFKGDTIKRAFNMRPNTTVGVSAGVKAELFGFFKPRAGVGTFYNTYKGYGRENYLGASFAIGDQNKSHELGINYNNNSQSGIDVDLDAGISATDKYGFNLGIGTNSRSGLKDLTWNASLKLARQTGYYKSVLQLGTGGSISFAQRTYFPASDLPFVNSSFSLDGTMGTEFSPGYIGGNFQGYYTTQKLAFKSKATRSFGYLYLQDGRSPKTEPTALIDYNQEKVRPYRKDMPHIAIPYGTYDLYSASGQGVSGQFRAVRNDVGTFGGQKRLNLSGSSSAGVEIGYGKDFRLGANVNVVNSMSTGQEWKQLNRAKDSLAYSHEDRDYEAVFFKNTGENVPTEDDFFTTSGADLPVKVGLVAAGPEALAASRFDKEKNKQPQGSVDIPENFKRNTREKRNQVFSYLTAKEAVATALSKPIQSHAANELTYPCHGANVVSLGRTDSSYYKPHHISEISVTQSDGSRYVYGIPAYNKAHKEVTFNVEKASAVVDPTSESFGLVSYTPNLDNTIHNENGRDHYFDKQEIAPYAYAHLLTAVLSPDYIDRTGDGITEDDPGNAVKINYTKAQNRYAWRTPTQSNMARYIEGRKTDALDDKGTYLYGEKEIWFVHSIESRTMVAQFYTSERSDAKGVVGENGGIGTTGSVKLDSIRLYSKSDLRLNGTNAVPIKTVRFTYDYSLCSGLPNNELGTGKLTLKKIDFVYQKSGKGKLNPYEFTYADGDNNPDYNMAWYDRWGGFQKNPSDHPHNLDFPYTLQDPEQLSPSAWSVIQIKLPSGALLNVEYESDDYAYVQDKRAHKMNFIQGFARDSMGGPSNLSIPNRNLYNFIDDEHVIYDYIVVSTDEIDIDAFSTGQIKKQFLEGVKNIYFNAEVKLHGDYLERINGYMELDTGRDPKPLNGGLSLAIPVKKITATKGKVTHPISLTAFQTMRLELQDITYGAPINLNNDNPNKSQMTQWLKQLFARQQSNELKGLLNGFERAAMGKDWARDVSVGDDTENRSWVKLPDPNYIKYGGGSRVKKITIEDQWNIAQGGGASTYGQEYSYRMNEPGITAPISSGVAAYEPTLGGEENALREPLPYKEKVKLAPSNFYYTETPLGESLYPAPVVGYRQVTVKNLSHENVSRTATGSSVVKFYTAKEFPVFTDFTNNRPFAVKSGALSRFFRINAVDFVTVSQGFLVEVNDMHGKMREEAVYNEAGGLIRSTRYEYKVDNPKAERLHLNNTVDVVYPNGDVAPALMGIDVDIWQDMQEDASETTGGGINTNLDVSIPWLTTFTAIPSFQRERTRLRTAATTKFIKRFGILDKVIVNENGSVASTRNVLFDSETGNVLLTETQNEFNDNVYAFNYPAHWAYEGMGQAYKNSRAIAKDIKIDNGVISDLTDPEELLLEGDEILITRANGSIEPRRYYIASCTSGYRVLDSGGTMADFNTEKLSIRVIRSGRRNVASVSIGAVESLVNPVQSNTLVFDNDSKVINASALTFQDSWAMFCERNPTYAWIYEKPASINPFTSGKKGNWRPKKSYVFYTDRDQAVSVVSKNRSNGALNSFTPFWAYDNISKRWVDESSSPWTISKEITMYDIRGNAIETKNPIGVYGSSQYGYNHTRVVAIADNASYREMAYEGFEDISFNHAKSSYACTVNTDQGMLRKILFGYNPSTMLYNSFTLDSLHAHTGKFSLKIAAAGSTTAKIIQGSMSCDTPEVSNPGSFAALVPDCEELDFQCDDCLPITALSAAESTDYWISTWVASSSSLQNGGKLPDTIKVEIKRKDAINHGDYATLSFKPTGPVIDGWQRIEGKIKVFNGEYILIKLVNDTEGPIYFDDFRFHPYLSNMKSFVYDNFSMRLIAELDENNYAMFYEYDDEGRLVRVKKETEKGVMTVKEARTSLKPN